MSSRVSTVVLAWALVAAGLVGGSDWALSSSPAEPTTTVPEPGVLEAAIDRAYESYADVDEGSLPDYIEALTEVDPGLFAIAVATIEGEVLATGDVDHRFPIMSAAKPFTLALVLEQRGATEVLEKIGVEPTGMPFNSIEAIEQHPERSINPLVNAGAMAVVSLIQGADAAAQWQTLSRWYRDLAGAELQLMPDVYESVQQTGYRNRAIANLLFDYGRLYGDPEQVREVYNRQSAVGVTTRQLAVMGAVLANGGVHSASGERIIATGNVSRVLAVMTMAGMYDRSGRWAYEVGLPAKSGVGGGVDAIVPGRLAIAAFSPRLDEAGNSVRAAGAIRMIAENLGLGLFGPVE